MTNIINAPSAVTVVRRLDVCSALIRCLEAILHSHISRAVDLSACGVEVKTSSDHVTGKLHVFINGIVDSFDPIGVVYRKLRVVRRLNAKIDDTVANPEGIKDQSSPIRAAIGNQLILLIEVVEERWTIVATIGFGPEVECLVWGGLGIQLRECAEESLKHVPRSNSSEVGRAKCSSIDDGIFAIHTKRGVLMLSSKRVETSRLFLGVGKPDT